MSDATGGIRNRYDFSFPVVNQNLPLKGTLHPPWAPSPFPHSLYLHTTLSPTQRLFLLFLLSWKYSSHPHPHPIGPRFVQGGALCGVWGGEVTVLPGCYLTQIMSYVSHLRRLGSITHSIFLKLCYVLVPEPIITIKQVDFRPNCPGKWHFIGTLKRTYSPVIILLTLKYGEIAFPYGL